jgi:uncharacterized membrane protein YdjX (TVP38/TMEM64 family)
MQAAEPQGGGPPGNAPDAAPPPRRLWWPRLALAAGLILAVAAFYALGLHEYVSWDYLRGHLDALRAQVNEHLLLAVVVFFLVYTALTALSVPSGTALSLIAGALFGRWLGTGVVITAATLGATLAFLNGRYLLRDWVQRRFGDRLGPINRGVERDGAYYLLALRLVPLAPFFLINFGMGLTRMRLGTYVWVSLLGMLPGTFLYVSLGAAATSVAQLRGARAGLVPLVLGLAATVAVVVVLTLIARRALRDTLRQPEPAT